MQNRVVKIKVDQIRELAKKKHYNIRSLEKEAEVGNGTINKWKMQNPKLDNLVAVADVLGVAYWKLVERIDK